MEGQRLIPVPIAVDIENAVGAALHKHGALTTDPVRASAILFRECAEVVNEALLMTIPRDVYKGQNYVAWQVEARTRMYEELAQVAATAALIMIQLSKEV